jgi:hypothetical protein
MIYHSENLEFEKAQSVKEKLNLLEKIFVEIKRQA